MAWMSRVTLDIDGKGYGWQLEAVRSYHNLDRIADEVRVTISSGGAGLHLEGMFRDPLTDEEKLQLRQELGDDPKRVAMDEERIDHGLVNNVLWTEKGRHGGRSADQDFATIWDALDHIDMTTRSDYERMHDLANAGHRAIREICTFSRFPSEKV